MTKIITPPALSVIGNNDDDYQSQKLKQLKERAAYMYETGKPFTLIKEGTSYVLESDFFNSKARRRGFTIDDLNFIKRVRKYVIDNDIPDKFIFNDFKSQKINYIDVKQYPAGTTLTGYKEIDLDKAYWVTAYLLGVIDKDIYEMGLSEAINKIVRLAALGSLAKIIERWEFDGRRMIKLPDERSYHTENIWFALCKRVSDIMGEAVKIAEKIKPGSFALYWVDAAVLENNAKLINAVQDYFKSLGYESKIKPIDKIEYTDYSFKVWDIEKKSPDDKGYREFTYPLDNRIKSIRQYNQDQHLLKLAEQLYLNNKKTAA